jgi:hypothetical protein
MEECTSNTTISLLKWVKIELTTTCPYKPEQNMVIERVWRTIGESAIALLLTASLPEVFWEEARSTACFLYNRSTGAHSVTHPTSPYEQYYGMQPHVLHFKVFGCKCYPTRLDRPKGNHTPKAEVGIFVGYQEQQLKGWRIYLPHHEKFIITAHVHFENDKFNKCPISLDDSQSPMTSTRALTRLYEQDMSKTPGVFKLLGTTIY